MKANILVFYGVFQTILECNERLKAICRVNRLGTVKQNIYEEMLGSAHSLAL